MTRRRPPELNRWRDARRAAAKAAKVARERYDAQMLFPGWFGPPAQSPQPQRLSPSPESFQPKPSP
jgi:hypothetical protein